MDGIIAHVEGGGKKRGFRLADWRYGPAGLSCQFELPVLTAGSRDRALRLKKIFSKKCRKSLDNFRRRGIMLAEQSVWFMFFAGLPFIFHI